MATKVPLSLTALDSQALQDRQVADVKDLQFVAPGIRAGHQQGVTRIFIRGIGLNSFAAGADASIALYADGVYIGRPTAQASSFFDVERIEVLRGPQAVLYGRNATGGALNVISRGPDREFGGYANLSIGNYELFEAEGAVNFPLSENGDLRARIATHLIDRDGYGEDVAQDHPVNNAKAQSVRGQLQYENGNGTDIRLIAQYHHEHDNNHYTHGFGPYPGYQLQGVVGTVNGNGELLQGIALTDQDGQDAATALEGKTNKRRGIAITLNANFELTDNLSLTSVTGYLDWERYNASNSDGTSAGLGSTYYTENSEQISQEFTLNWSSGPLDVVAGASYYHEKIDNHVFVPFFQFYSPAGPFDYIQDGKMDIDAFAAYAQATYAILPELRITAGGRWSTEKRDTVGTFTFGAVDDTSGKERWSDFTPKLGIEFDVGPTSMLYASYTEGFKSGTWSIGQVNPVIDPETIKAYEVGFKTRLFDNKFELTGAYFHYDYSDLQVNKVIGIATVTANAASAKVDGFELAATLRPVTGLRLDGSFNYLDSRFSEFFSTNPLFPTGSIDPGYPIWLAANPGAKTPVFGGVGGVEQNLKGYQLPGAPKYSFTAGAQYDYEFGNGGVMTLRGDLSWSSRVHFSEFNDNNLSQPSVTKINALLRYESSSFWSLSFWGKNLTNKYVQSNELVTIALWGYPRYGAIEPPRTYGATFGAKF
ncbi:TonB-dependent receptor [Tsuneonella sp. CC-YZS046]|uniref:TonB-dependent receptor n=1 Tax=Tsuneonella sp. CC-YZS046 TaxID=3042152 RepID=UPI002D77A107|nr:TonB-dependent receptor [Tsuneonella sp. CC-YZS046]WRO65321.1 TonB-dependent receptor [Tsuneonella sp. CC-YZS046]